MKKLLLVLTVFAGLSFTSCDKDEDGTPLIVGKWSAIHAAYIVDGKVVEEFDIKDPEECRNYIEFTLDGKFTDRPSCATPDIAKGTYTTSGIFLTRNYDDGTVEEHSFSVSVSKDILKITGTDAEGVTDVFTFERI